MKTLMTVASLLLAVPSIAQAQNGGQAKRIDIAMANFKYTPSRILLRHGETYVLHFTNQASGGHNFVAKSFFANARIDPADRAKVSSGEVDLEGGESVDVRLVAPAAAAIYPVRCSHFMHQTFGMKGEIAVQ